MVKRVNRLRPIFVLSAVLNFFLTLLFVGANFPLGVGWDLSVYLRAIELRKIGLSGYENVSHLNFVYHPFILEFIFQANKVLPFSLLYILFCSLVIVYFFRNIWSLSRVVTFQFNPEQVLLNLLIFFGFTGFGYLAFFSLNIGLFLHLFLWMLLIDFYKRNSRTFSLLYLFIVLGATFIKPYFILYLSFSFFLKMKVQLPELIASVSITFLLWLSGYFILPDTFQKFSINLKIATVENQDLGVSFFGILHNHVGTLMALGINLLVSSIFLILSYERFRSGSYDPFRISLLIIPIITLNPRLKEYDFAIAVLILSIITTLYLDRYHFNQFMNMIALTGLIYVVGSLNFSGVMLLITKLLPITVVYSLTMHYLSLRSRNLNSLSSG